MELKIGRFKGLGSGLSVEELGLACVAVSCLGHHGRYSLQPIPSTPTPLLPQGTFETCVFKHSRESGLFPSAFQNIVILQPIP